MKKLIGLILSFFLCCALTCIGYFKDTPILACLSAIASAVLGSVISIIFEAIDSHGQGFHMWYQQLKYRKKEIRLSFSYLFKIQIDGKYLLIKGNRLKNQYQPVGGVYKYYPEAKPALESFRYISDIKMGNTNETDDLRINIKGKNLLSFMEWFLSMKDREYDPCREFREELLVSGLLPSEKFSTLKYRKIGVHNKGILYSKYLRCDELVYADIFELRLSEEQMELIRMSVKSHPDILCLASSEELKSECYGGIEKNIGNNGVWLLGE